MTSRKHQPLYIQLVELLKNQITNEYEPDALLKSERELADYYHMSRTTVRLALQELEKLGYVYRKHGKGTFVSPLREQVADLSGAYSFSEQMKALGKQPETYIQSFRRIKANRLLSKHLNLPVNDPVIELKRLRVADNIPMLMETTYLPGKKFQALTRKKLEHHSLYDVFFEEFHEVIKVAEEEFLASIASISESENLHIAEGAPVLNLSRTTYNIKNEVIEYTLSVARADQFRYKIQHIRNV